MTRVFALVMVCLAASNQVSARDIPVYGYQVVNVYPHDSTAFTQGLIFKDGFLYEGTGLRGRSSLRKVELETGNILKIRNLASQYFGEGVTIYRDTIIQLTWRDHIGFVYVEQDTFELIDTFAYPTEGWGLTHDGTYLIMSDGTSVLYFVDPQTYEKIYEIEVRANGVPVTRLNELEYIQGKIYSNIWVTNTIAIIDPQTGDVLAWLNLEGLLDSGDLCKNPGVLNGIAFDSHNVRLFVTGKTWPNLFEIDVTPLNYPPAIIFSSPSSPCSIEVDSILLLSVSAEDPDPEDTLEYAWSVNGEIDISAHDSTYSYTRDTVALDTVKVEVSDGMFSDSTSWTILVSSTAVETENSLSPDLSPLSQSFPNPFKKSTTIKYAVPERALVSLEIYDTSGRMVQMLVNGEKKPGIHSVTLDAKDFRSGVYFARFVVSDFEETRKLIVIR